ncbi:MAG TPA: DUF5946 family protein [Williamsia sp.]
MTAGLCVECGAPLPASGECWTRVHELLEIETRVLPLLDTELGMRTHFFAVSTYQLQHPFRVAADALTDLGSAVAEQLADGARPIAHLRRGINRSIGTRKVGRQAEPGDRGHVDPDWPRSWSVTAADVVTMPDDNYPNAVAEWARSTLADLGNLVRRSS